MTTRLLRKLNQKSISISRFNISGRARVQIDARGLRVVAAELRSCQDEPRSTTRPSKGIARLFRRLQGIEQSLGEIRRIVVAAHSVARHCSSMRDVVRQNPAPMRREAWQQPPLARQRRRGRRLVPAQGFEDGRRQ